MNMTKTNKTKAINDKDMTKLYNSAIISSNELAIEEYKKELLKKINKLKLSGKKPEIRIYNSALIGAIEIIKQT